MLPDRYCQLLTAYVDGELSGRQRRHVQRLLHRSREARSFLRKLERDSKALRALPKPGIPEDLAPPVLHTIATRRLKPSRRQSATSPPVFPAWVGLAAAAAVLMVVGFGSYLYFSSSLHQPTGASVARNGHPSPAIVGEQKDKEGPALTREIQGPPRPTPEERIAQQSPPDAPSHQVAQNPPVKPVEGMPVPNPTREDPILTSGDKEMFKLEEVKISLPVTFKLRDFDQQVLHNQLMGELQKDKSFRMELPCRDGARALERLQSALKLHHVGLIIDQVAQRRLVNPQWKTNYVLFFENITPEELASLLEQIGVDDKKGLARRPPDVRFDGHLVLTRMTPTDHKELSTLLGVDPTVIPPRAAGPLGVDPRKPLSELTASQVTQALEGQGGNPRPGASSQKPSDQMALVLAYNPVRPNSGSAQVKQFLDTRKPARPGTIQVLLVLRHTN
jgi:hypothetical protein